MKNLLFAGWICLALILASGALADPDLVIYYSYDNFGAIVPDESGKSHDGTIVGDVAPSAAGKRGGAAKFAKGSYIDLDGANFTPSDIPVDAMTLCAWFNIENTGEHHAIFNARAEDSTWVVHPEVRNVDNQFRWLLRAAGGQTIFDVRAGQPVVGQWMHFAGTYDSAAGVAYLYINGEPTGSEPARIPNAKIASDWKLGARVGYNIDNARPFTGLMDDFCIYKKALNQDEIREVMTGGPPGAAPVPDEGSLISTWGEIKGLR